MARRPGCPLPPAAAPSPPPARLGAEVAVSQLGGRSSAGSEVRVAGRGVGRSTLDAPAGAGECGAGR